MYQKHRSVTFSVSSSGSWDSLCSTERSTRPVTWRSTAAFTLMLDSTKWPWRTNWELPAPPSMSKSSVHDCTCSVFRFLHQQQIFNTSLFSGLPGPCKEIMASEITKNSCKVSWDPPDYDGGTPVVHYVLQVRGCGTVSFLRCDVTSGALVLISHGSVCLCSGVRPAGGRMSAWCLERTS